MPACKLWPVFSSSHEGHLKSVLTLVFWSLMGDLTACLTISSTSVYQMDSLTVIQLPEILLCYVLSSDAVN
jgi:hypothetical protein